MKKNLSWLVLLFLAVIPIFGDVADDYNRNAIEEQGRGDWKDALADYNKVIELKPDSVAAYYNRASVRQTNGDWSGALDDFNKAVELNPKFVGAYYSRGALKNANGDVDGALADFDKVIELSTNFAEAYRNRGLLKRAQGDADGALADLNQAIELQPDMSIAYFNRGVVKRVKGDYDGAMADFNQAIQLNPRFASAFSSRGNVKRIKGDLAGAMADFATTLKLNPKHAEVHRFRAMAKVDLGDFYGALADFQRAIELNPQDASAIFYRGVLYYNLHDFSNALVNLQRFCNMNSRESQDFARFFIWLIQARAGEKATATSELQTYLQARKARKPPDWTINIAHFLTGELSESDLFKAAGDLDKKKNDRQQCEAWFFAGSKRLIGGDKIAALDFFTNCLATNSKNNQEYTSAAAELKYLQMRITIHQPNQTETNQTRPRTLKQALASVQTGWQDYDGKLKSKVFDKWHSLLATRVLDYSDTGIIVVKFILHQDGSVSDVEISGNSNSRAAPLCEQAITDCSPFPKWPDEMRSITGTDRREIKFTFSVGLPPQL
jgi:tetratricopeptide (TPR) repeat protein